MPLFGKKTILSKAELSTKLLELGQNSDQFTLVNSPETDFIVERKIVDATGYGTVGMDELKEELQGLSAFG